GRARATDPAAWPAPARAPRARPVRTPGPGRGRPATRPARRRRRPSLWRPKRRVRTWPSACLLDRHRDPMDGVVAIAAPVPDGLLRLRVAARVAGADGDRVAPRLGRECVLEAGAAVQAGPAGDRRAPPLAAVHLHLDAGDRATAAPGDAADASRARGERCTVRGLGDERG